MPKVLQLNVTANWGSTGKIAEGIGVAAMQRGWESTIAYGRYANPSKSSLLKVGNKFDVYCHYLRNRVFDGEGLGSRNATRKLVRQIQELQPDIIHLHNIHDHWLNYPLLFEYLATINTPIVWTFHDCWAFTGHCAHFITARCDKWHSQCNNCPINKSIIDNSYSNYKKKNKFFKEFGKRMTIISVSEWLDSVVAKSFFKDFDHQYIYNGIDTNVFNIQGQKHILNQKLTKPFVLGVSNVWPESKGLKDFIKLRNQLSNDIDIVLVGLSEKQISGLPQGIIGIPRTNNVKELAQLYTRAIAVLSLSSAETFGLTLVEGLACGTPSIGYSATAIKEMIEPNTGILTAPGDIAGITNAIKQIINNPDRFTAENCRNRAVEHFNKDVQFNKYIDLYNSLLHI